VSTNREIPTPRLIGAGLCASASLLLLLNSFYLFARDGHGWGAVLLLLVGLGLLLAAVKSFGRH
jgi:membrane-bound ClpP family serine protease